jgi:Nuclease A inhibitor-like protein
MTEKSEKSKKKFAGSEKKLSAAAERLKTATTRLVYVSEIDAPFTVFDCESDENILHDIESKTEIEKVDFEKFFEPLTRQRDWHGERETLRAKKFLDLQKLIEESLTDLKVYRIGRIRIRILIVGRTSSGCCIGLETNAIET